jgi:hypothetical protein
MGAKRSRVLLIGTSCIECFSFLREEAQQAFCHGGCEMRQVSCRLIGPRRIVALVQATFAGAPGWAPAKTPRGYTTHRTNELRRTP